MRLYQRHSLVRPVPLVAQQPHDARNVVRVVRQDQPRDSGESFARPRDDIVLLQFLDHPVAIGEADQQLPGPIKEFTPAFGVEADVLVFGDDPLKSLFVKLRTFWRFRHHGLTKQR
ncbi:hypothetical protein ACIA8G_28820 [Lentzea sp. NPDC051213]|uniref:hypothetical protein n=1 Tax=Lentzea sp. NPDC051213 TaxID=3364126 RepID=UPI0037952A1E